MKAKQKQQSTTNDEMRMPAAEFDLMMHGAMHVTPEKEAARSPNGTRAKKKTHK